MINIGDFNRLKVKRKTDIGYYLGEETSDTKEDILLPNSSLNENEVNVDDEIEAFIYRDSDDRVIATLKKPLSKVGELAYLKVVSTTKVGTFINFGLEKDILVPFKEKIYSLQDGKSYLFYIYLDKSNRIAATTYIDKYLQTESDYKVGDMVKGTVYGFQTNRSVMIAVDNLYKGVILNNEYFSEIRCGQVLDLRVNKIYEDGKLGLTPRKSMKEESDELQESILEYLQTHDGFMNLSDKSSPDDIRFAVHVSKKQFKNSLGGLMKKGLITQDENGTKLN
jgi:predicted RNA-binding protein (virulence factor B family)